MLSHARCPFLNYDGTGAHLSLIDIVSQGFVKSFRDKVACQVSRDALRGVLLQIVRTSKTRLWISGGYDVLWME
jgi:hypothetical protein